MNGFRFLHQAYAASDPGYTGKVTVPTLWDKKTRRIVNNESSEIIRMLNSEFKGIAGDDTDYYPAALRPEIDRINELVYTKVNNGVYRCGLAKTQAAYEAAYDAVFEALDELENRLGSRRFLVGDTADGGGLAALSDAGALRRRVLLAFPLQPPAHGGLPESVALHARALPHAGHRRDGEAALLRDQLLVQPEIQPERHRAERHARLLCLSSITA